jgi:sugar (pentulose or hexulose) kinase
MTTTQGTLGIDAGTQGLSVIFTDEAMRIRATGAGDYAMVPGLAAGCYEQRPRDWEAALVAAMADLRAKLAALGVEMDVLAVGISGQMHGEVLADAAGEPLGPARLWCDGRNEAEGHELTERLGVKMPKRITAARWLWTIRNRPELAARVARITTPAGWIAHLLTGGWTLGIGDAAGMFPIDQASLDYDARLLADFDALVAAQPGGPRVRPLRDLLPAVRRAGQDGGTLDARGAKLLGLPQGIPVAPAEGDQPAALAGAAGGGRGAGGGGGRAGVDELRHERGRQRRRRPALPGHRPGDRPLLRARREADQHGLPPQRHDGDERRGGDVRPGVAGRRRRVRGRDAARARGPRRLRWHHGAPVPR